MQKKTPCQPERLAWGTRLMIDVSRQNLSFRPESSALGVMMMTVVMAAMVMMRLSECRRAEEHDHSDEQGLLHAEMIPTNKQCNSHTSVPLPAFQYLV